jgi:hypothetical protein
MNKINLLLLTAMVAISTSNIDAVLRPMGRTALPVVENLLQRQPAIRSLYSKKGVFPKRLNYQRLNYSGSDNGAFIGGCVIGSAVLLYTTLSPIEYTQEKIQKDIAKISENLDEMPKITKALTKLAEQNKS